MAAIQKCACVNQILVHGTHTHSEVYQSLLLVHDKIYQIGKEIGYQIPYGISVNRCIYIRQMGCTLYHLKIVKLPVVEHALKLGKCTVVADSLCIELCHVNISFKTVMMKTWLCGTYVTSPGQSRAHH